MIVGRQLNHSFPSMLSEPQNVSGISPLNREVRSSVTHRIVNTTRVPIFWRNATGVVVTEAPEPSTTSDEAIKIVVEYEFSRGAAIDTRALLQDFGSTNKEEINKTLVKTLEGLENVRFNYESRCFKYVIGISYSDLAAQGGVVYLNDLDLVVGFDSHRVHVEHPYSQSGIQERLNESLIRAPGIQQRILMVDNTGRNYTRWINTGQAVLEVHSLRDPSLRDGVYVTYTDAMNSQPNTLFFSLEEAQEKLGLYLSIDQAEAYGNPDDIHKRNIKELEREVNLEKHETMRAKAELDRERSLYEQQVKDEERKYAHEKEKRDREYQRFKEEMEFERQRQQYGYDMNRNDRKDKSESWKATIDVGKSVLGVISICLSLFLLLQKSAKKEG